MNVNSDINTTLLNNQLIKGAGSAERQHDLATEDTELQRVTATDVHFYGKFD